MHHSKKHHKSTAIDGRAYAATQPTMLDKSSPAYHLPKWQRLAKKIHKNSVKKSILNMRFVESLFDDIYGRDGTVSE